MPWTDIPPETAVARRPSEMLPRSQLKSAPPHRLLFCGTSETPETPKAVLSRRSFAVLYFLAVATNSIRCRSQSRGGAQMMTRTLGYVALCGWLMASGSLLAHHSLA